ncbi:MAG: methyltransferase family protein [Pseudomonadales bacterium]
MTQRRHLVMLESVGLAIRNIAMIVLFPGTVAFYIPYRILDPISFPEPTSWLWTQYLSVLFLLIGASILLRSIWSFAHVGRGTLAPFDETQRLIVVGLYRFVRNPMYVGVVLILLAESWFFMSFDLLQYTGLCFLVANVVIIGYEENRLRHKYGNEYRRYCGHVGRWIPGKSYDLARKRTAAEIDSRQ